MQHLNVYYYPSILMLFFISILPIALHAQVELDINGQYIPAIGSKNIIQSNGSLKIYSDTNIVRIDGTPLHLNETGGQVIVGNPINPDPSKFLVASDATFQGNVKLTELSGNSFSYLFVEADGSIKRYVNNPLLCTDLASCNIENLGNVLSIGKVDGSILKWSALDNAWLPSLENNNSIDADSTNELITQFSFGGISAPILSLTEANQTYTIDLSPLSQTLSLQNDTLSISGGNSILLPAQSSSANLPLPNSANETLRYDGSDWIPAPNLTNTGTDLQLNSGGLLCTGITDSITASGAGTRMMWIPSKAAFRAGIVSANQWDLQNIGRRSLAMGQNNIASGHLSTTIGGFTNTSSASMTCIVNGKNNTATNNLSTIVNGENNHVDGALGFIGGGRGNFITSTSYGSFIGGGQDNINEGYLGIIVGGKADTVSGNFGFIGGGQGNHASGEGAVVIGGAYNKASGLYSMAGNGYKNMAVGDYSTAIGENNIATGLHSRALGSSNIVHGSGSTAIGNSNTIPGYNSTARGTNNLINGSSSTVIGSNNTIDGSYSTIIGSYNTATGEHSLAIGQLSRPQGSHSIAIGLINTASKDYSLAIGFVNQATGNYSRAIGRFNTASGGGSTAIGSDNTASGSSSTAMGSDNTASGDYSTATGRSNLTNYASLSLGRYNRDYGSSTSWNSYDYILTIGDGTSITNRSNCLTVTKNGTLWAQGGYTQSSDHRLKENLTPLTNSLENLQTLNGLTYNWKNREQMGDRTEIGLIAQDIEKVYPELITEVEGYKAVNYIGLIAPIIEALKEQQSQIESLQPTNISTEAFEQLQQENQSLKEENTRINVRLNTLEEKLNSLMSNIENCCSNDLGATSQEAQDLPYLGQNIPNPFNTRTSIGYYIPNSATEAFLTITDMKGIELKRYPLTSDGYGNLEIEAGTFPAGSYLYSLFVDGQKIDTKRMLLTK